MTLQEYLAEASEKGIIDFSIRCQVTDSSTEFYIYPLGKDGKTLTFQVESNNLNLVSETGEFEAK